METVNYLPESSFNVVMAPAFRLPNTYFIFRSAYEQIVITITGNSFVSSSTLKIDELKYIEKYYPFLDIITYKVKLK